MLAGIYDGHSLDWDYICMSLIILFLKGIILFQETISLMDEIFHIKTNGCMYFLVDGGGFSLFLPFVLWGNS